MQKMSLDSLLDVMGELFSDEVSIAVSDSEKYVYYRPSKRIDLKIKKDDPIKEGTIAYQALQSKSKVSEFIHRSVLGIPYHGMAVPYYQENNEIAGCVVAIYPVYSEGKSVVTIKTDDGWKPIPFPDVMYFEAKDRKTHVISDQAVGTHKNTLQEFEYLLPRDIFLRCHRSFIINVQHINEIYPDTHSTLILSMKDGTQVPVSQSYSSYFRKLLGF